ncbi:hypothetical protein [Micromonospora sp. NBC_00860]|uniref:hypothetical protein n=1 Tax=Micromonospora sp. NBC_00860 TaxID=2975980 RepID=UPI0038657993|nr:hypothetical protein OH804_06760 [Micromonospora sp. NBC_00860]
MITAVATPRAADGVPAKQVPIGQRRRDRLLVEPEGRWEFMTTPEQSQQERALETGAVYQDAEGRRTTDPGSGTANADSEADRNAEHLKRGEVGPRVPEE